MSWKDLYKTKLVSAEEAVRVVNPNDRVFYSLGGNAPLDLINALSRRLPELGHLTFITGSVAYPFEYLVNPEYKAFFKHHTFFLVSDRTVVNQECIEPYPFHFSSVEDLLKNQAKPNVMMCECAPPDEHGYFNYGCFGTYCNHAVARRASKILIQVNRNTPVVYGRQNVIHISEVDHVIENDHELFDVVTERPPMLDVETRIAGYLVERIEDGSTLQIGVGGLANAVSSLLESKKNLGVYSEYFMDSFLDLIEKGIINGKRKTFHHGEITCSFGPNSRTGCDFVHKNPAVMYYPVSYINNPYNIARNDKMVSINNALMVDLTGQVCAESLGFKHYSGTGGQVDFVRGAMMAKDGQSFITLPSCVTGKEKPISRIVLTLPPGQAVTTLRTDVDKVVTEYGIAELRHKSISERVNEMIRIAHPQFRDELRFEAKKAGLLH